MRRRDVVHLCLLWGALLAGLVWALSTQFSWVQQNKPLLPPKSPGTPESAAPSQPSATGVIGDVDQDTREAMARDLEARKRAPKGKPRKPGV